MFIARSLRLFAILLVLFAGTPASVFACCCTEDPPETTTTSAHDCCADDEQIPNENEPQQCDDCFCLLSMPAQILVSLSLEQSSPLSEVSKTTVVNFKDLFFLSSAQSVPTPPPQV